MADEPTTTTPETHAGGRPLKFESVEELQAKIDQYFQSREPFIAKTKIKVLKADGSHFWQEDEELIPARPKTMEGLARALDVHRSTLTNYKDKPEYFDTIARAKAQCAEYSEEQLYTKHANGAIFALKNNYGWKDETEVVNKGEAAAKDLDSLELDKAGLADEAAKELEEQNGSGSPATEQVVAPDAPVPNQE